MPAADSRKLPILDDAQRAKLAVIAPVLEKDIIAAAAISMNLIETPQWLRGMCPYPPDYYASPFGLSDSQQYQLALLRQPFHALIAFKMNERGELLQALTGEPRRPHMAPPRRPALPLPKEIVELDAEISSLISMQYGAKPPRYLAWNILNKLQKEFFNEFATYLQIATEAVELGLLPPQFRGEPNCH